MKKWLGGALILFMVASNLTHAVGVTEDEQWPIPNEPARGHHSVLIEDTFGRYDFFSLLRMRTASEEFLCKSLTDKVCESLTRGSYNAILPPCSMEISIDCVESLEAIDDTGKSYKAIFREFIYGGKHPNLFEGDGKSFPKVISEPGIWVIGEAKHSGGTEYALSVGLSNSISRSSLDFSDADLDIQLYPVSRLETGFTQNDLNGFANFYKCHQKIDDTGRSYVGCGGGAQEFGKYRCAMKMIENATCLLRRPFPSDFRFKVTLRMTYEPAGMMHGRLFQPNIRVIKKSDWTSIEIEAGSLRVPVLYSGNQFSALSPELQAYWDSCVPQGLCGFSSRIAVGNDRNNSSLRNIQDYAMPFGERSLNLVNIFSKAAMEKSIAAPSAWNLKTLSKDKMLSAAKCFKRDSGFIGVVTTNSTTYSEGPPVFQDGFLSYKVASLHYLPSGEVFKGNYNLVLRSDVARCLYGFTNAPISASIEVLSSDGSAQVATTVVNEKDNWLYLSANGFTFSSPTVRVELSQEVSPLPAPEMTTQAAPKPVAKKLTITCAKGKIKKKVTGAKPACPRGYKKVA